MPDGTGGDETIDPGTDGQTRLACCPIQSAPPPRRLPLAPATRSSAWTAVRPGPRDSLPHPGCLGGSPGRWEDRPRPRRRLPGIRGPAAAACETPRSRRTCRPGSRTCAPPSRPRRIRQIPAHLGKRSLPRSTAAQRENPLCANPPDEILERGVDSRRVGLLPAQPGRFLEHVHIKHKICTLHTHSMRRTPGDIKPASLSFAISRSTRSLSHSLA